MAHHLHHISHRIKHILSRHISVGNLKRSSFVISLVSCLSAGSIMLFSLFSTSLHELVGFTYLQINFIASLSAMGMYLCLPFLGYLADCYGPSLLSLFLIWFFCPSYFVNSWLISRLQDRPEGPLNEYYVYAFGISFCFIGLATSSLYFSSLLTCAKIYPDQKGLAISLPVTCYGISTLIGSQLMKLPYFKHSTTPNESYLNLYRVFVFFGCLYLFMGILNFVANSVVIVEQEVIFNPNSTDENTPLLDESCSSECPSDEETLSLAPQRSIIEPQNHKQRFKDFLRDKSAWIILISLVLNVGPMESYQNNLGSIIKNTTHTINLSNQVSVMATSSTITRLLLGGFSDYLASPKRRYPVCRVWLLLVILVIGVVGQAANKFITYENDHLYPVISALNGSAYGGIFTIYPTIIASVWGIDMIGSTWGSFMVAPAVGSIVYSLTYGHESDSKCSADIFGASTTCLHSYFDLTTTSLVASIILILIVWRFIWCKRGFILF